jgi:hypothetical protein
MCPSFQRKRNLGFFPYHLSYKIGYFERLLMENLCINLGKISARTPLFFHGSSPIFQIEKTFRPEISLFLGMKHF